MTAVDTNVLVRLLTADLPRQTAAAKSLFATELLGIDNVQVENEEAVATAFTLLPRC